MPLDAGTRLGPYELVGLLGAGGMGEVYRARDSRVGRTVAIKVLPATLASAPDRRQRLVREARAIAALNHPNICTLYEFDRAPTAVSGEPIDFLVMEFVEGETLAERLHRAPPNGLRLGEALGIAIQVADALAAAHRHGIVHRDLKPGNIMLTKGTPGHAGAPGVKLLDFGLARLRTSKGGEGQAFADTVTAPLTDKGTLVGTVPYMAPEQLEGRETDARTDLFAFGAIVYEMVAGRRAFEGDSQASLITAIMSLDPPPLSERVPLTPPLLERTVRRCLAKDPDNRWAGAHDVADELRWIASVGSQSPIADETEKWRFMDVPLRMWLAAGFLIASVGMLGIWQLALGTSRPLAVTHVQLGVQPAEHLGPPYGPSRALGAYRTAFALSPAGDRLVFSGFRDGRRRLFVRDFAQPEARVLSGTENGIGPFFSPDGGWVGFWADGALKKAPVAGGPAVTICAWRAVYGASWGPDGRIVMGGPVEDDGLWQVSAAGGTPEPLTTLDPARGEVSHRLPRVLPGGHSVIYTVVYDTAAMSTDAAAIAVVALDSGQRQTLIDNAADARYVRTGHLVFARDGALLAVPFDPDHAAVGGGPVGLVDGVTQAVGVSNTVTDTLTAQFDVSSTGTLVYVPGGTVPERKSRLVWVDRQGAIAPLAAPPRPYSYPRLSPDGQRIALTMGVQGVWLYDLLRGTLSTLDAGAHDAAALWTPDGTSIVFDRAEGLALRRVHRSGDMEWLTQSRDLRNPSSWTPDGQAVAVIKFGEDGTSDIWVVRRNGDPYPLVEGPSNQAYPVFSPDGRWLAYSSNETGRQEVYVQAYPGPGSKSQVSADGGYGPLWAPSGRELFFRTPGDAEGRRTMMVVDVSTRPTLQLGKPRALFSNVLGATEPLRGYDVSLDGRRFLMVEEINAPPPPPVTHLNLVLNWFDELKARVPAP